MKLHPIKETVFTITSLLALAALGLFHGCSTTGSQIGKQVEEPKQVIITQGMPAADLLASLGEPNKVEDTDPPREGFEIWTYHKSTTEVHMATTGTKETPHFDPITGAYQPILDPIVDAAQITYRQTTKFLIGNGTVISWKVERDESHSINK